MSGYGRTPKQEEEHRRLMALPFRMVISDIFTIKNRGVVVAGKIESGELRKNDPVLVIGKDKALRAVVTGMDMYPRTDNAGLLLRNVQREDIEIGMIVTTEGL
jgi:translation elongation factor EF-Tu-like GTPase